jgi:putative transposase
LRTIKRANLTLPKGWPSRVRSAILHVISLAQYAAVSTRSWAADSMNARVRLRAEKDQLRQELALVQEELRIHRARMAGIPPHRRPFYRPTERLAILELRAARGWSLQQTAVALLVTPATVAAWMKRLEDDGPDGLVQVRTPVNRFPDFVRYSVQRLQTLCPTLGKKKLAEVLARAGLHLATTTIGRIRKEQPKPGPLVRPQSRKKASRVVTAKRPNHVWHVDVTVIPTQMGFWCPWLPFALPQTWPFCWWLAVVLDHYSRRALGFALFWSAPTSVDLRAFLGRTIPAAGRAPRHLISDKGRQFFPSKGYRRWCKRHDIRPRFGAVGQHGSIAVIERFIRTLKEAMRFEAVSTRRSIMHANVIRWIDWYNEHRPHSSLGGRTPNEVYFGRFPAHRRPRIEPRPHWPRGSPCARPQVLVAGRPGARFHVEVERINGQVHLPVVRLRRAA